MKCLDYFGNTSTKEDTPAPLSGRGEFNGGLVTLKNVLLCFQRMVQMIKCSPLILPKE